MNEKNYLLNLLDFQRIILNSTSLGKARLDSRHSAKPDQLNFLLNRFLRHYDDLFGHYDDQGKVSVDCRLRTYRDQLMLQKNLIMICQKSLNFESVKIMIVVQSHLRK